MLKSYLTILLLFCATLQVYSSGEEDLKNAIQSFLTQRCDANADKDAFIEVEKALEDLSDCFFNSYIEMKAYTDEEAFSELCTVIRHDFHSCLVSAVEKVETCLNKEERFVTNFASEWLNITFDEHCDDGLQTALEHVATYINLSCSGKDDAGGKCFATSTVINDLKSLDFVLTKSGLCGYLLHANECFLAVVKEICKENVYKLAEYHLRPTKIWCEKHANKVDE